MYHDVIACEWFKHGPPVYIAAYLITLLLLKVLNQKDHLNRCDMMQLILEFMEIIYANFFR